MNEFKVTVKLLILLLLDLDLIRVLNSYSSNIQIQFIQQIYSTNIQQPSA